QSGADFIYFDTSVEYVYADLEFRDYMQREFGSRGFAAGSFVSAKGLICIDELSAVCRNKESTKQLLQPKAGDKPFFNYLIDIKRINVSAACEIAPELAPTWAGHPMDKRAGWLARISRRPVTSDGKIVPFLHWAGFECDRHMPNLDFYLRFRLQAEQSWSSRRSFRHQFLRQP